MANDIKWIASLLTVYSPLENDVDFYYELYVQIYLRPLSRYFYFWNSQDVRSHININFNIYSLN
jgi:hypothetical protein